MPELQLRGAICEVGRRLWQCGLIGGAEGNISCRLSPRQLLITPSGVSKGHLKPNDILIIDLKGQLVKGEGKVSSEVKLHTVIYANRSDCQAVVHAHPPVATGFALAGEEIPDNLLPESAYVLGSVATVPFSMPGTQEVPDRIEPLLEGYKTFLLASHGAAVMGKDLHDACYRMETLERVATVILHAKALGGAKPLPEKAFDYLLENALNGSLN
ncbi:MAG: class II aldolase/adducin family protein [Fimbriimonadaceae bacterium]|nr:MAG: class II aldolase/adducin family protein [Fimbriimonadaceae bacterium]